MLKIVLYSFCFFVYFQSTIYASANKRKLLVEDPQSSQQQIKKGVLFEYYKKKINDIVETQDKIMKRKDMMPKCHISQKELVCSRKYKVVSPLKKKHKLKYKVDCRSIDREAKDNLILKKKVCNGGLDSEYKKKEKYILKAGKILQNDNIEQNKKKRKDEKKLKNGDIECIASIPGLKKKEIKVFDCRVDGGYTSRLSHFNSPEDMKNGFFYSGKKLFALKTIKKNKKNKKDVFGKTCQPLKKGEHRKVESFDKTCQPLKKGEHRKVESFDKTCKPLKKGEHRKEEDNTDSNEKVEREDEGTKQKNVVIGSKVSIVGSNSTDCGLKYKRVNKEGIPVPFAGSPHHDDILVCGFIYCPRNASSLVLTASGIADLSPLRKIVNLRHLVLTGSSASDFSPLSNLLSLDYLDLSRSSVKGINFLSKLVKLRFLNCGENKISDIKPLSGLVNLEYLILRKCPIVDISPLLGLFRLTHLFLEHTNIVDITPLSNHVKLKLIDLSSTQITDISPLGSLGNLEEVLLADCCDLVSLSPIKNLNNIVRLDLSWHEGIDLKIINGFSNLRILDLSNTDITTRGLVSLSNGPVRNTLKVLHLNSCSSLERLYPLPNFVNLEELSLSFFQNQYLLVLGKLSSLIKLSLKGIHKITDINFLWSSFNLEELDLSECISLEKVDAVCNMPKLQYLNVSRCPGLFSPVEKAQETLSIFSFVDNLRTLDVSYNNIDPADIKKMKDDFAINKSLVSVICNED